VLSRLTHDPATRAYAARRAAEGKTPREIKRYTARRLFRNLEANGPQPALVSRRACARTLGLCS
jgi:transposase